MSPRRWARAAGPALLLSVVACTSPESHRTRGGGPGADVGNRGAEVVFHDGARPYYQTPCASRPVPCDGPTPVFSATWRPD
ncbi:MAG: hypothetical protein HYS40_03580 [Gemmatimonadetes bacterium]|nr:hypothetical protein [Gemmatimonadota bacterium]